MNCYNDWAEEFMDRAIDKFLVDYTNQKLEQKKMRGKKFITIEIGIMTMNQDNG